MHSSKHAPSLLKYGKLREAENTGKISKGPECCQLARGAVPEWSLTRLEPTMGNILWRLPSLTRLKNRLCLVIICRALDLTPTRANCHVIFLTRLKTHSMKNLGLISERLSM